MSYAELAVTTNFTFLTGASHPEELVARAAELGLAAIAITDRNSVAGVVRAHTALKEMRRELGKATIRSTVQVDTCSHQPVGEWKTVGAADRLLPKLIVGSRLVAEDCPVEWLALPTDRVKPPSEKDLFLFGKVADTNRPQAGPAGEVAKQDFSGSYGYVMD